MLTYKRKLKLSKVQEERILSWIGTCRFVYNMGMEIKKETWKNKQLNVSGFDLMKQLTEIKDYNWISDVPAQSLQNSLERLDRTYKNFFRNFKKGGGFPKFKSKKKYNSILFKSADLTSKQTIKLPKIGQLSFFKDKCKILGKIKTVTIKKQLTGYYMYIVCDEISKNISNTDENQVIGIDMGIANFCTDSNGNFIENPKHFNKYQSKLNIESRSLSRKKKFSNRWKKQVNKLGLLHHKITNVRKDFLNKESTNMAKKYHTIYLEDLNINKMVKDKKYSKGILDCGWGMFRTMLEYKTNVVRVDPKYTSQTCNECGEKDAKSRLSQSEFVCTSCGHISNADVNAAKNIMSKGIALNRKRKAIA